MVWWSGGVGGCFERRKGGEYGWFYCLLSIIISLLLLLLYYKFLSNVLVSYLLCMISLILVLKNLRWELAGMKESWAAISMWRKWLWSLIHPSLFSHSKKMPFILTFINLGFWINPPPPPLLIWIIDFLLYF